MRRSTIFALAFAAAGAAQAGGFFGTLTIDGQLPGRAVPMQLVCAGQTLASANADQRGSYQFGTDREARACVVRVEGATAPVVLFPNPTRYDFALTHVGGAARLVRR